MSAEKTIRSYAEAFARADLEALVDHYAEPTDYRQPFVPEPLTNREAILGFESTMFGAFTDIGFDIEWLVADGDEAAAGVMIRATHVRDLATPDGSLLTATGKTVVMHTAEHIRVDDGGKIIEHRRFADTGEFFAQLAG